MPSHNAPTPASDTDDAPDDAPDDDMEDGEYLPYVLTPHDIADQREGEND